MIQITILGITATFMAGIIVLIVGAKTKRKWIIILSAIPIIAALSQMGILFLLFLDMAL